MDSLTPGRRFGRYEIRELLGTGGMGQVYRATLCGPAGFRKPVALKVLHQGGDELVAEARLGGLLKHPNLIDVYALEKVDGLWVCAMEYASGGSLSGHLPLSPRAAVEVARQVCAALSHAWSSIGLVHLDLKPENLLLDGATVKVADLGVARAHGMRSDRIRGTPAYMAPEQRSGVAVDPRTDLWALGVVLVELLTCRPVADPGAVPWLEGVLRRCLHPDPSQRFQSALALDSELAKLEVWGPSLAELLGVRQRSPTVRSTGRSATFELFERPATNLVAAPEPLVGRDQELAQLGLALASPGLVTLKGMGGLGKTRLAIEAARAWHASDTGEVWLVDLSAVRDAGGLLGALARVFEMQLGGGSLEAHSNTIGWAAQGRGPCLLVCDNFEQIVDCSWVVDRIRAIATELRVLVTSRSPLDLDGEHVVELAPLEVEASVQLLVQRASAAGIELVPDPVVRQLAERLEGIPLALGLAAGRLSMMSPAQILQRLDGRLKLLGSRHGGRHATLSGTLEWSWELLDPPEQAAFAQCSVFRGGFTVADADAVIELGRGDFTLDVLQRLVDRSLLRERGDGRLDLFESVRVYAASKLVDGGAVEVRHGRHYAGLGAWEAIGRAADLGPGGRATRDRVAAESANLRAAVDRAVDRGDPVVAAECLTALITEIYRVGPISGALVLAERVAGMDHTSTRGRVDGELAWCLVLCGRAEEAADRADRSVEAFQRQGDSIRECMAHLTRAVALRDIGQLDGSWSAAERALELAGSVGDVRAIGRCHAVRAALQRNRTDPEGAIQEYELALQGHRASNDGRHLAVTLVNLSSFHGDAGRGDQALACAEEAMGIVEELGDLRFASILAARIGLVFADRGSSERARAQFDYAIHTCRRIGAARSLCYHLAHRAQLELAVGQPRLALELANEAHQTSVRVGHPSLEALFLLELCRVRLLAGEPGSEVHPDLVRACEGLRGWSPIDWAIAVVVREDAAGGTPDAAALAQVDEALEILAAARSARERVRALGHAARIRQRAGVDPGPTLESARRVAREAGLVGPFQPSIGGRDERRPEALQ